MTASNRRVMGHGMFLFLLGMLTAFVEPHVTNVRMGLAEHIEHSYRRDRHDHNGTRRSPRRRHEITADQS